MGFQDTSKFKAGFADGADDTDEHRSRYRQCLCGWPDLPGRCPGPDHCPMHGQYEPDHGVALLRRAIIRQQES